MLFNALFGLASLTTAVYGQSRGCGTKLPAKQEPGGFYNATIGERRYVVFIPPEYSINDPAPLIVSYHGGSRNPENQIDLDLFTDPEFNTDKMVVYPEGTSRDNCADDDSCFKRYWSIDPAIKVDDISFTQSILDELTDTYCLDTSRFFASGKSQGGGLIGNILACDETMSTTFAAFAPVSGAFYTDADPCAPPYKFEIPCQPGRNDVPMLEFHGGRDDVVNYTGANQRMSCLPNIPWWVESWAINDGLSTNGQTEPLADDTPNTNITRYGTGSKRGLVSHVFDAIIRHHWPSTTFNSDNNGAVAEFNATPIIIDFFDSHPL